MAQLEVPVMIWWHGKMTDVDKYGRNKFNFKLGHKYFNVEGKAAKLLQRYTTGNKELRMCFESNCDFDSNPDHCFIEKLERIGEDEYRIVFLGS